MKKMILAVLAAAVIFVSVGCGKDTTNNYYPSTNQGSGNEAKTYAGLPEGKYELLNGDTVLDVYTLATITDNNYDFQLKGYNGIGWGSFGDAKAINFHTNDIRYNSSSWLNFEGTINVAEAYGTLQNGIYESPWILRPATKETVCIASHYWIYMNSTPPGNYQSTYLGIEQNCSFYGDAAEPAFKVTRSSDGQIDGRGEGEMIGREFKFNLEIPCVNGTEGVTLIEFDGFAGTNQISGRYKMIGSLGCASDGVGTYYGYRYN